MSYPFIFVFRPMYQTMGNYSNDRFADGCLSAYNYQMAHNEVYRKFVISLSRQVHSVETIPFLPVRFFKTHEVRAFDGEPECVFETSGTTASQSGRHLVKELQIYDRHLYESFTYFYGDPAEYSFFALLPSYLERSNSSLVYMAEKLIEASGNNRGGFYLNQMDALASQILANEEEHRKSILLGVSFALLDFAEQFPMTLHHTLVMETGGMKGRRPEMTRDELHAYLCSRWNLNEIHSEYGMTELLSQAYSKGHGKFFCPPSMKVFIRDLYDPFTLLAPGRIGGINIIDLANIYSCPFIETEDVGVLNEDGSFEVLGRMDNSELRGCNLLVT